jgi:hypothetical protein
MTLKSVDTPLGVLPEEWPAPKKVGEHKTFMLEDLEVRRPLSSKRGSALL